MDYIYFILAVKVLLLLYSLLYDICQGRPGYLNYAHRFCLTDIIILLFVLLFILISQIRWVIRLIKLKLNTSRRRIIFMSIL